MSVIKHFEHLKIQLEDIVLATNNFAAENCIGKGGFGQVYKGDLIHSKGHTTVALKRLDRTFGQGGPEFWKEIIMLTLYKHENVVSLLGFCDQSGEKILVYEYASKRSLDLYLNSNDLSWVQRLKICIGIAHGLAYLHNPEGTQQRVLHRDIKSSNILLDENWNARIGDLGLSKFGPANQKYSFLISNACGTVGYCDPQYVETGLLTKESDIYSFGVVLFEILCGRLCICNNNKHQPLIGLVRKCYKSNSLREIIHGNIRDEINPSSLEAFATIAYQCLKQDREERPLISEIITKLKEALENQRDSCYAELASVKDNPMMRKSYYKPPEQAGGGVYGGSSSMDASRTTTMSPDEAGSASISNVSDLDSEWLEEDEPGVYITIRQSVDGKREVRRVRFSRELFGEVNAKQWWEQNRERIKSQYEPIAASP